jgi:hypothetical protein
MPYVLPAPRSSLQPAVFSPLATGVVPGPLRIDSVRMAPVATTGTACLTNILTTVVVGRFTLTMNPEILFGAYAGTDTSTVPFRAVPHEPQSKVLMLGYTAPCEFGYVRSAWGPVIVPLRH